MTEETDVKRVVSDDGEFSFYRGSQDSRTSEESEKSTGSGRVEVTGPNRDAGSIKNNQAHALNRGSQDSKKSEESEKSTGSGRVEVTGPNRDAGSIKNNQAHALNRIPPANAHDYIHWAKRGDSTRPTGWTSQHNWPNEQLDHTEPKGLDHTEPKGLDHTEPKGLDHTEQKRLHHTEPKRRTSREVCCYIVTVILVVSIAAAAGVFAGIISIKSEKEHTLPNIIVTDLKANLSANVSVPSNLFDKADLLNLTQPDGTSFLLNPRQNRKKRQADDKGAWSVSVQSAEGDHMKLTLNGLPATCTSAGNYSVILMSGNEAIFEDGFTITLKNTVSSSGTLKRINKKEKSFQCKQISGCEEVGLNIYGSGEAGSPKTLKDVTRQCRSTYSNSEGYKDECIGKTNYSAIACGPFTSTPNSPQFLISECDSNPCQHGGSCHVPKGADDYTCTCIPGYEGHDCEIDINECLSNPCRNGASCTDIVNGYTCACKPGYTGATCSKDINECTSSPCSNKGLCQDHVNGFLCSCKDGFTGTLCETDIDECSSNPCSNGGSCTDRENSYRCQCRLGYTGTNCETNIDECASNPCKNGGKCKDGQNGFSCDCELGFTGSDCGTDIDECSSTPCVNGGTCRDTIGGFSCECPSGYTGLTCDTEINFCESNPCKAGECNNSPQGYECACATGYTGTQCQTALPGKSCQPDVTCVDHAYCNASGVCQCTDPYITSDNGQQCSYGCSQKCPNEIGDAYSNAGDVCGSEFKRCVNGTLYIEHCKGTDVFDTTSCVCVRHSQASWCAAGIPETRLQEVCASECSKSGP